MIQYDLKKIKFGTDRPTFERGVDLYERGKVTKFEKLARKETMFGWEESLVRIFDEGISEEKSEK